MMETIGQAPLNWRKFVRLLMKTKPSKAALFTAVALNLMTTLAGLVIPMFMQQAVDGFQSGNMEPLQMIGMGAAFFIQAIAAGISVYLLSRTGQQIVASLRNELWEKHLRLPIEYYDRHQTGETISRITNDTGVLKGLIAEHLSGFVTGIISVIGALVMLFVLDWQMTLVMLVVLPLTAVVLVPLGKRMYHVSRGVQDETAAFSAVQNRVLSEIRLVKASNAEAIERENGIRGIGKLLELGIREGKYQAWISPIISTVMMLMFVAIIGFGGLRVSSGALTAGALVAFLLYVFQIVMPVTQITQFFTQFQKAKGATERIIETLEQPEEEQAGKLVESAAKPLALERVSFGYGDNKQVLTDVSFTAKPGTVTAIVGPSGGGKTTLFSLLERFYEPTSGIIRLGDDPIGLLELGSWRSRIGYVSQDSPLVAGTIRDNICYGLDREVGADELELAAAMAYADEFIGLLPKGFDTEVGERGTKLSGGQRQRIAIARALLRNPQLLMLDEATSALDSKSEIVVQRALHNLMQGRTTLVIAHRLCNGDRHA